MFGEAKNKLSLTRGALGAFGSQKAISFDQDLSFKLCGALADLFHRSNQVRLLGLAEAMDRAIWQHAKAWRFSKAAPA